MEGSQGTDHSGMRNQRGGHEVDGRRDGEVSAWRLILLVQMISLPGIATSLKMRFGRLGACIILEGSGKCEGNSPCTEE